jgi:D,D-heptose 1,7-bisphosphate phosphatase
VNFRSELPGTAAGTFLSTTEVQAGAQAMLASAGRTRALLLAAGLGTRLRPITDSVPKCLVPIDGEALLDFWVECLIEAGITEARINTHALANVVAAHIHRVNTDGRLHLLPSYEPILLGSAGTITANADVAERAEEIVIIYADNLSDIDLRPLLSFHRQHGDPLTMVLFRAPNPRACGIAEMDLDSRIVSFVEKPQQPASDLANAGVYVLSATAYREIAEMKALDIGFDVLPKFVGRMRGWVWGGYYLDVGTHEALDRARRESSLVFRNRFRTSPGKSRPAIFLDRDGTLIEHEPYLSDPALVRLVPGVSEGLRQLRQAGFAIVLVTNQSAIGRGMLTEERLDQIHTELNRQLAAGGATIDCIYHCSAAPVSGDRTIVENPDRKPGPGMLLRAAADLNLDLGASWMVGDLISDVLAGLNAGCRSILVKSGQTSAEELVEKNDRTWTAANFAAAVDLILRDKRSRS